MTEAPRVRHEVVVPGTPEQAFRAFTERMDEIKPKEHNLLSSPIVATTFEPHVGGHVVDRAEDGSECRWARVLAYDPPHRLVFSWDIGPMWQLEADPAKASEVEVRFIAEGQDRTRVELEHRHLDGHGPGWQSIRDGVDDPQGWPLYLARYAALLAEAA
ncbi:SRPBCC family protein [Terrabacter terrae]|uniref:SRPBCC family protein n=1 Tax=Terrabacter terrae TaxID=318434 RepID=A0ABP5G2I6_9MICO